MDTDKSKETTLPEAKEAHLAWLAGLVDGEASISIARSGTTWSGWLTISSISPEIIQHCKAITDAFGVIAQGPWTFKGGIIRLQYGQRRGSQLLKLLLPFLQRIFLRRRAAIYLMMWDPEKEGPNPKGHNAEVYLKWKDLLILELKEKIERQASYE